MTHICSVEKLNEKEVTHEAACKERLHSLPRFGEALRHLGEDEYENSQAAFAEAERIQSEKLTAFSGYEYCDFTLY
jgi:hypothetical protein